jgi:uncharacterized oxidoreductase
MDFTRDGEPRHITHEIEVNLTAPVLLTEAALPELRERPRATLVFVTSGLALSPKASAPVYCATKAALRSFTRSLRWQLEGSRVRVVEVLPPIVDTAMTRGRGAHKLTPDEVARDVVRGLAQGDDELFIGRTKLLRLVMALSPRLAGASTRRM